MSLPAWLHSQINSRPPFEQTPGERVDAWNVATWTSGGLCIVSGAHDRAIAERDRNEYNDSDSPLFPGTYFVVPGATGHR